MVVLLVVVAPQFVQGAAVEEVVPGPLLVVGAALVVCSLSQPHVIAQLLTTFPQLSTKAPSTQLYPAQQGPCIHPGLEVVVPGPEVVVPGPEVVVPGPTPPQLTGVKLWL